MEIREIRADELSALLALYSHYNQEPTIDANGCALQVFKQILTDPSQHILVLEQEGALLSTCTITVIRNLTHSARPYALVENVITHSDYRKQGFASAVLKQAKQIAKDAGCYKIMLLSGAKDSATLDFYRKAGYNSEDKTGFILWL
ncbi:MAG: GNAT family N-acetyltransferase [Christensenellaceae bacterium]|jgi:GNAT superfamily N-acetyltransferase